MQPHDKWPRLLDAGEGGLVVELGDRIDAALNDRVVALGDALDAAALAGVQEIVPTYRSLLILFDPLVLPRERLKQAISSLGPAEEDRGRQVHTRWRVPVHYGGEHGVDLEHVATTHGLSPKEVVALHAGADYRVYMIGFAPGFAYLGGLPEAIHTSRRTEPRMKTPPRSISIGGVQTAVSPPLEIPSGWHLIGRTPVRSYDPRRTDRPFLFSAGDGIRFEPVSAAEYEALCADAEGGALVATREDGDA